MFYRFSALAAVLVVVSGCDVVPTGEAVPINKLIEETEGRPFECLRYDSATNTCEGIAERRVSGDSITYDGEVVVPAPPGLNGAMNIRITMTFAEQGVRYCGDLSEARVRVTGNLPPSLNALFADGMRELLRDQGWTCTRYFRYGENYVSVSETPDGRPIRGARDVVTYFADKKPLRPKQP